jgi:hypothetical protein
MDNLYNSNETEEKENNCVEEVEAHVAYEEDDGLGVENVEIHEVEDEVDEDLNEAFILSKGPSDSVLQI